MEAADREELIKTIAIRFDKNTRRHEGIDWSAVQTKLEASPRHLEILNEMERTGGEPDVIGYDRKTMKSSSWIKTPESVRKLGGALFCDRRYDQIFTYHNGAESYYAARGFRGLVSL